MSWTVAQVMTKDVVTAWPDTGFKECADLMRLHGVSALPVVDGMGRVLGIVSESDLLAKEAAREDRPHVIDVGRRRRRSTARVAEDVMTSPVITVPHTTTVPQAARIMHARRVKRLPVVDAYGTLVGIVSRADVLKTFLRSDEAVRRDVVEQVLRKKLFLDPKEVDVEVTEGIVHLRGAVETRSLADLIERKVAAVEGTVGVDSLIKFRLDDSRLGVEPPPRALQLAASERGRS
jgi:CBS domain-containing protein